MKAMSNDEDPQFNFEKEVKPFLEQGLIKKADFLPQEGLDEWFDNAAVNFTTLEKIVIEVEWSTETGIYVVGCRDDKGKENLHLDKKKKFDSLEGLFNEYSPMYRDKFMGDLGSKL